jgi:hypothetical protein
MDADTPQDKENQSQPEKGQSLPKEISLKYDVRPIEKLTEAIANQTASQQQKDYSGNDLGERQLQEQQRANTIFADANRINEGIRRIAKRSMRVNWFLLIITIASIWISYAILQDSQRQFKIINSPSPSFGWVSYVFDGAPPVPMQPGIPRRFTFQIINRGTRPLHVISFKYCVKFDTIKANTDFLINQVRKQQSQALNVLLAPGDPYPVPGVFKSNPTKEDSADIQAGNCTLSIELKYLNDVSSQYETSISIFSLKDHHSPNTLVDSTLY